MPDGVAATRLAYAWGGRHPGCRVSVCAADAAPLVVPVCAAWDRRLPGAEPQEVGGRGPLFSSAALLFIRRNAGIHGIGPPSPLAAFRRTKDDMEWHEVVSRLAKAPACGIELRPAPRSGRAAPAVEVGPSLRAKIRTDAAYGHFVDAVVEACRSPHAEGLGATRYAIEESRDMESPGWITITLTVWFSSRDLSARMDAWSEMRRIVDGYIVPLRDGDDGDRMRDIDGRFFISMGSLHA